jgi:hypothetical protein
VYPPVLMILQIGSKNAKVPLSTWKNTSLIDNRSGSQNGVYYLTNGCFSLFCFVGNIIDVALDFSRLSATAGQVSHITTLQVLLSYFKGWFGCNLADLQKNSGNSKFNSNFLRYCIQCIALAVPQELWQTCLRALLSLLWRAWRWKTGSNFGNPPVNEHADSPA